MRVHVGLSVVDDREFALGVHAADVCMDTAVVVILIGVLLVDTFVVHFDVFIVFEIRLTQLAQDGVRLGATASFHFK